MSSIPKRFVSIGIEQGGMCLGAQYTNKGKLMSNFPLAQISGGWGLLHSIAQDATPRLLVCSLVTKWMKGLIELLGCFAQRDAWENIVKGSVDRAVEKRDWGIKNCVVKGRKG